MTGKSLHASTDYPARLPPHWWRAGLLSLVCGLGGCAGPELRLHSTRIATPAPIAARGGAADAATEHAVLARALGAAASRPTTHALIDALRTGMPHASFVAGNRVTMYNDGPSTFAAYAEAIAAARNHVHVETYIFADDELGTRFAELLIEKRRLGVEVRVLYDGAGSWASDEALFARMREAGIDVHEFRPLASVGALASGRVNNRDHRKMLIVDGRVAFVGGINISGTYEHGPMSGSVSGGSGSRGNPLDDGWRDSQARIDGPAVAQFQALFFSTWTRAGGDVVTPSPRYFPRLQPTGNALVAAVASEADGSTAGAMHAIHLNAIRHAAHRLWITQAYFTPDRSLRDALVEAARRGVDTRILLPGVSDSELTLHASRSIYGRLLAAGVRIYEHEAAFVHAKTVLIDDAVSFVGSANLDLRSLVHNNEIVAVVIDTDFARLVAHTFETDLQSARGVTREAWRKRPWSDRLRERAARLFWYWI
ncbi:MAG: cardiolipin synthase [Gammaproteobacteria bacterium]